MKQKAYILICMFALLWCAGCSDDDDFYVDPVLDLSAKEAVFAKGAGSKEIEVTINATDAFYTTITDATQTEFFDEWVTVTEAKKGFTISVTENTYKVERKATVRVYISKGDLTQEVKVTQSANDEVIIGLSKEEINAGFLGEEVTVYVKSNVSNEWTVSVEAEEPTIAGDEDNPVLEYEWITIIPEYDSKKFTVTVAETGETEAREATILVEIGDSEIKLPVKQEKALGFYMPFLKMGYNYEGSDIAKRGLKYPDVLMNIFEFEEKNGGSLMRVLPNGVGYIFASKSPSFVQVDYIMDGSFKGALSGVLVKTANKEILESESLKTWLNDQGYKHSYDDAKLNCSYYWNKNEQIYVIAKYTLGVLEFRHSRYEPDSRENQKHEYKTFAQFPYPYIEWGATVAEVQEWEKVRGSSVDYESETEGLYAFMPDQSKEPDCIERAYYFSNDGDGLRLYEVLSLFNSTSLMMYWPGTGVTGIHSAYDWPLTREFEAFSEAEGFVFDHFSEARGMLVYYNEKENLGFSPYLGRFSTEGNMPRACMYMFYMDESGKTPEEPQE